MSPDPHTKVRKVVSAGWLRWLADEPRLLMLLPGLFWAGNAIVARSLAGEVPPIGLAFWRWTLGAMIVLPFAWQHLRRDAGTLLANWRIMLVLSALGIAFFNTGLYLGAQTTTAINIVMLQTSVPVLIVVASFVLFGDAVSARQALGISMSLFGALTLISHGDPAMLATLSFNRGDLWMLAAGVSYAAYTALLRRRPPVHALSFLVATFVIGAGMLLPLYAGETLLGQPMPLSVHSVLAVGYVAVFASIMAYLAFNRTVELLGANTAGLTIYTVPVFGTILAMALLGERPHLYHAAGICLIAAGIYLATRKEAPA